MSLDSIGESVIVLESRGLLILASQNASSLPSQPAMLSTETGRSSRSQGKRKIDEDERLMLSTDCRLFVSRLPKRHMQRLIHLEQNSSTCARGNPAR